MLFSTSEAVLDLEVTTRGFVYTVIIIVLHLYYSFSILCNVY